MPHPDNAWTEICRTVHDRLQAISDPAQRALAASREMDVVAEELSRLAQVRLDAVQELRDKGLSHNDIGNLLDITRERAAQLSRQAKLRPLGGS